MEINQARLQNQPSKTQDESQAKALDKRSMVESSQEQEVKGPSDLKLSDQLKQIQKAQADLIQRPAVDMERVNQVKAKLEANQIDLLNFGDPAKQSALEVAGKLVDLELMLDDRQASD